MVPEDWLAEPAPFPDPASLRAAYVDLLLTRLEVADGFEGEADRARIEVRA
jgi:hypothetical protein